LAVLTCTDNKFDQGVILIDPGLNFPSAIVVRTTESGSLTPYSIGRDFLTFGTFESTQWAHIIPQNKAEVRSSLTYIN